MSYILDALKKADLERRRGRTPDFMDPHGQQPQQPKKPTWFYLLLAILFTAAGGLGWYFGHDDANLNEVRLNPAPVQIVTDKHTAQQQTHHPAQTQQAPGLSSEQRVAPPSKQIAPDTVHVTDTKMAAKSSTSQRQVKERPAVTSRAEQAGPVTKANPNRIYSISELPEAIRQGLPAFSISTHIYSAEPSERLASINGNIGREGKELMPGIMLDSVVPDGAILKYQGYRFKIGLR